MKNQLLENDDIKYWVEHNFKTNDEIAMYLNAHYKNLGESTLKRRASTIKPWLKFDD